MNERPYLIRFGPVVADLLLGADDQVMHHQAIIDAKRVPSNQSRRLVIKIATKMECFPTVL